MVTYQFGERLGRDRSRATGELQHAQTSQECFVQQDGKNGDPRRIKAWQNEPASDPDGSQIKKETL